MQDGPRRMFRVCRVKHHVPRPGIFEPLAARRQVHWTEFPLAERIIHACLESALLLFFAYLEPNLDELNSAVHNVTLNLWAQLKETEMLFFGAKAHDVLHASAVVPTAIKDHDLTRSREVLHVTLHIHLGLLAVRRRRQGD